MAKGLELVIRLTPSEASPGVVRDLLDLNRVVRVEPPSGRLKELLNHPLQGFSVLMHRARPTVYPVSPIFRSDY